MKKSTNSMIDVVAPLLVPHPPLQQQPVEEWPQQVKNGMVVMADQHPLWSKVS
jgi:hypothetical protein